MVVLVAFNCHCLPWHRVVGPANEEIFKSVGALGVIVDISRSAEVGVVWEGPKLGGNERAGNGAGIHLPKHHSGRFQEAERRVDREKLARGTGRQGEGVVHREPVSAPITLVARQFC